ncbi:MAG: excinuclease ABC subunit UvrA, partial [Pseudobutyrivibrio sp.]|nr:excinuclease ABC subunit UvrA [Pseudobutyrivibrio sp.]
ETFSESAKKEYEEFMFYSDCPCCHGQRLKKESLAVTIDDKNIFEMTQYPVHELYNMIDNLHLTEQQKKIGAVVLKEIKARLKFMVDVGLDYLTLSRATATLSGGEAQRIRLATQIGSGLVGVAYILDEPSIGLHQKDNDKLLASLKGLRDLGNTLIVVEHDADTMKAADYLVDIGPRAGKDGGQVIAAGTPEEIMACPDSITGQYLSGKLCIPVPKERRQPKGWLTIKGAREHNLKNIDVDIPLGIMTVVTGVSGSGKSSLVNEILYKDLAKRLNRARKVSGKHDDIIGTEALDKVIDIDQSPIGRTPRSNPATYTGVFDLIRDLFAGTTEAKERGYSKGRFSFNVKGGRCEACSGDGIIKIEMHFLPDVYVPCEVCGGKRYNRETLEVHYKGKTIYDILDMTVEEAVEFFKNVPSILNKIQSLYDVGLGYIKLGQPSTTLSGGEAQRIKLATELSRRATGKTIYILDEPTTGLHFDDVNKLVEIMRKLSDSGNTVVVIEHNLDVIKCADYIIDMGPDGGDRGGTVIAKGTPEEIVKVKKSYTGQYLKEYL